MKGVPVRIEMGPRDIENGECILVRRDNGEKITVKISELENKLEELLKDIQISMFNDCKKRMEEKTTVALNMEEFKNNMECNQGFIKAMWCGKEECENKIREVTGAKSRCMPFEQEEISDKCVCCGEHADHMVIWGRQY